jgi:hypothetical protein
MILVGGREELHWLYDAPYSTSDVGTDWVDRAR